MKAQDEKIKVPMNYTVAVIENALARAAGKSLSERARQIILRDATDLLRSSPRRMDRSVQKEGNKNNKS